MKKKHPIHRIGGKSEISSRILLNVNEIVNVIESNLPVLQLSEETESLINASVSENTRLALLAHSTLYRDG